MWEFIAEKVAKHNKWVIVDGTGARRDKVSFPIIPGGEKVILSLAVRDVSEEINMMHDPKDIPRYAPDAAIGKVKA